jgi:hypothetical protein
MKPFIRRSAPSIGDNCSPRPRIWTRGPSPRRRIPGARGATHVGGGVELEMGRRNGRNWWGGACRGTGRVSKRGCMVSCRWTRNVDLILSEERSRMSYI